jgi:type VI secretion system protein ImpL
MTKQKLIIVLLIFAIYEALVWGFAIRFLPEAELLLVGLVLSACGITLVVVYLLVARIASPPPVAPPAAPPSYTGPATSSGQYNRLPPADTPEALLAEAQKRMAKVAPMLGLEPNTPLHGLPLFLLFGAEGSGKTSLMLASGINLELLAGQVARDAAIVPTASGNVWLAGNGLVVEEGGRFLAAEPARWIRFLQTFCPPAGMPGRAATNLRGVILCCDITAFLGIPDVTRLAALASRTEDHMHAITQAVGADFPVYVLFTKCDAIPYFGDYFRGLADGEEQQILGCTLTASASDGDPEAESRRITAAFNNLYVSLAEKRLQFLRFERDPVRKAAIYEFPRELRRIRGSLIQFLAGLSRRNPGRPGPILQGFYFAGLVELAATAGRLAGSPVRKVGDATYIVPQQGAPVETVITRWAFVQDFFRRLLPPAPKILPPLVVEPRRASPGDAIFAVLGAVSALTILLFVWSWYQNRALVHGTLEATAACRPLAPDAVPSAVDLQNFETLRRQVETLTRNRDAQPPFLLRMGLYQGDTVLEPARRIYFARFRQYFLDPVLRRLEGEFTSLPAVQDPSFPYATVEAHLRAYQEIVSGSPATGGSSLGQWLLLIWRDSRISEPRSDRIAQAGFETYCREIRRPQRPGELLIGPRESGVVQRARAYLNTFHGLTRPRPDE